MGWFGKKEIVEAVKGVGTWVDELNLTAEEEVKLKMELFRAMEPFKIIQRIMVTIIMRHWMVWGVSTLLSLYLGYFLGDVPDYELFYKHVEYAKLEMVWIPTASAVALYLGGGLPMYRKKTDG
tara:strand:+ start:1550 stop:1918 length:369 start_codon:yes stop_codon:yes gene_type:complete